ncbi:MAG: hypothetical protein MJ181_09635 [Treponema sp.]|nr:hypothetical protein [Treponema sp.]
MKKILLCVVSAALCLAAFTGCSNISKPASSLTKDDAAAILVSAQKDFDSLFNSGARSAGAEMTEEQAEIRNSIIAAGFEALATGADDAAVVELLKENGLYESCMDIIEKYDLEEVQKVMDTKSTSARKISASLIGPNSSIPTGAVLLSHGNGSSTNGSSAAMLNMVTPGIWKHAGIYDARKKSTNRCIYSASNKTDKYLNNTSAYLLGAVGWESIYDWADGSSSVCIMDVRNRTKAKAEAAINYGVNVLYGKGYNLLLGRDNNDGAYCSKVVYRCWKSQGINLEPTQYWYDAYVTPQDLADDGDTFYLAGDRS